MFRSPSSISKVFPAVLIASLSVFCAFQWSASRSLSEKQAAQLTSVFHSYEGKVESEGKQLRAALRSMRESVTEISRQLANLSNARPPRAEGVEPEVAEPEEAKEVAEAEAAPAGQNLPPLPEGVNAQVAIRDLDVQAFFDNPDYNPEGVTPTRVQLVTAQKEVTEARAQIEVLKSEMQLGVTKAVESLKTTGDYVDYREGDVPQAVPGVLSAAEQTEDNGYRMFYIHPDQFPDIYKAQQKSKEVAEVAFRRLLSMVKEEGNG